MTDKADTTFSITVGAIDYGETAFVTTDASTITVEYEYTVVMPASGLARRFVRDPDLSNPETWAEVDGELVIRCACGAYYHVGKMGQGICMSCACGFHKTVYFVEE